MADVYTYVVPTGVITTDTQDIQTQVQDEYKAIFGEDLNLDPSTPQGELIAVETLARVAVADNNAALANQINPGISGGVFLDAIIALTNPAGRQLASSSSVLVTITGAVGTIIPAGSQASETGSGQANVFQSVNTITIPPGGTITNVEFTSVVEGPIPAATNTLTQIISQVLGWETITNPAAATLGQVAQSDIAARDYRRQTLFAQGTSLAGSMIAAVSAVTGVSSMKFIENPTPSTATISGVSLVANSLYMCVNGGTDLAVATAMVSKKSGGCAYNNGSGINKSVAVTEPFSGQVMTVLFDRPNPIPIEARVTVSPSTSVQDPQTAVRQAITDYANGLLNGEPGLKVGIPVSSFEFAGAINIEVPGLFVHLVEIKKIGSGSYSPDEIPIAFWEIATITSTSIEVITT